jgi:hypothetical protein
MLQQSNNQGLITINYGYARYGTGTNPVSAAAHLAADWVRYDNGRTKYWEIGNENFGNWEAGYRINVADNKDGQPEYITGDLYGQHFRVFADSMRKAATEIGKQISEIQRHYLPTKTTVNAWINKCHIIKGKTPSDLMYDEYKEWCKKYGYNPRNLDGYNNILRTRFGVDEDGNIMIDASNGSASTFVNDLLKSDDEDTSEIDSLVDSEPTKVTPNVNDVDVEDDTDTFFAKLANREN